MDATRIAAIREHIRGDQGNVELQASDWCTLINESGTSDEGLRKAASELEGHVGFVSVPIETVAALLEKMDRSPANTGGKNAGGKGQSKGNVDS